jgi:hypothetical protein
MYDLFIFYIGVEIFGNFCSADLMAVTIFISFPEILRNVLFPSSDEKI